MSKKRKKSIPVAMPQADRPMVIDMNKLNLKKQHKVASFRTGGHMTAKDRPRKKNWKREYEHAKDSHGYQDTREFFFVLGQETWIRVEQTVEAAYNCSKR